LIGAVHLGCDLQPHAAPRGDLDRPIWAFLRRNATEESEIAAGYPRRKSKKLARKSMMNGPDPVHVAQVIALIVRNGDQGELWKDSIKGGEVRQIEPTM
jgi:hypothetical protein